MVALKKFGEPLRNKRKKRKKVNVYEYLAVV